MALTGSSAVSSSLYARQASTNASYDLARPDESSGKMRTVRFDHTLATGEGSGSVFAHDDEMNLCIVPAGSVIDLKFSYFKVSADLGANTTLRIGVRAFRKKDGSLQAEDPAFIASVADASVLDNSIAAANLTTSPGTGADALALVRLNSREPVVIFAKAGNGTGTFDGDIGDVWSVQISHTID